MDIRDKKILLTGGTGFLGSAVCDQLIEKGVTIINYNGSDTPRPGAAYVFGSNSVDLTSQEQTNWIVKKIKPDVIIHMAAVVGGIGANQKSPGTYFYKNLMIGTNVLEAARAFKVAKTVIIGTICSYPKFTPAPFKEIDLWNGYPEDINAPYGIAKKTMLVQAESYKKEFGLNYIYLMPTNLYGPRDNFDLETSHVIPALIRKCVEAKKYKKPFIDCWGSGSATREFLYVKDAADAIIKATMFYDSTDPINIGSGEETSIKDLVDKIANTVRYNGEVKWDESKPDGQPRRLLDITKATAKFGFTARTTLQDGLTDTVKWYDSEYRDR